MTPVMHPLIQAETLCSMQDDKHLVVIHAGFGETAYANYLKKHLKGTRFVELNTDLSDIKENAAQGGRHPLPAVQAFARRVARLGITAQSHVVVYDENKGANAAARFWWMLKALGHQKVQVLDGGPEEAEQAGFPTDTNIPEVQPATAYTTEQWLLPTASLDEVTRASEKNTVTIIDVREPQRYQGITEPIDLIAGHIPGAINKPYQHNLNTHGRFKEASELRKMYQEFTADTTLVHCGSGVTACHTLLAFAVAGLPIPKLYVGSWSEWSRNNKPMATGTHSKGTS
ncbi:sulfurtransferase [Planktosalinus lacus]|uniref:Thiosulfate sulfurtransferase n=1 Tax=Planktosalinus lacus TaxID=1526573 RepID=A0A8J2V7Z2_9FLAO|nr:sulfurtransferase [Planktosalinus lacus]GGD85731.1 thiosulfate sulfurtransferase [Planktosalinus lacus]